MNITDLVDTIYGWSVRFMPVLRVVWTISVVLGTASLILAIILKKNPARKKSPWIVGGLGLLLALSSGTQLMMSFY